MVALDDPSVVAGMTGSFEEVDVTGHCVVVEVAGHFVVADPMTDRVALVPVEVPLVW